MRPSAIFITALALLLGGGLLVILQGTGARSEGPPDVLEAPLAPESTELGPALEGPEDVPASTPSPAGEGRSEGLSEGAVPASKRGAGPGIDVFVFDRSGGPLLGPAGSLPPGDQAWVRPVVGQGHTPSPQSSVGIRELQDLKVASQRVSGRPGWVGSAAAPPGPAFVALCYGDQLLVAEPLPASADSVTLVADLSDLEPMYARVEGSLAGLQRASALVRVIPATAGGQIQRALPVTGTGERFVANQLPPGPVTIQVRGEALALGPALAAAKKARGLSAISLGARVPTQEQWDLRLGVLRQLQLPVADIELILRPGERRDLGVLPATRAAAVIFQLSNEIGQPMDATGVDILVLVGQGAPEEPTSTWTFETNACVYPLHSRLTTFMVVQGDRGALVDVQPVALAHDRAITDVRARLAPLSVVTLPRSGAVSGRVPSLWTARRAEVRMDPRWIGSRYCGHEIGDRTLIVPAGSYLLADGRGGAWVPFTVQAGEWVDASDGSPKAGVALDGHERAVATPPVGPSGGRR